MYGISKAAINSESGVVLIVCMIILLMLSIIGIVSLTTSNSEMEIAGNEMKQTGAFYAAEAGLEEGAAAVITSYEITGQPPDPLPYGNQTVNNYQYVYNVSDMGPATVRTLSQGTYSGLYGLVKPFEVVSSGADLDFESGIRLVLGLEEALIPIFQFAVFYEYDLEIAPGPDMTLGGRVHTNGDLYLQARSSLYIDSYLSAAGDIRHGRKAGSGQSVHNGDVFIRDRNGVFQNMRNNDGTFLDSSDPDWVNRSISRWGGYVEDINHGITELYMPVVSNIPSTNLIDRADGNPDSYENRAGLKFVDGQALYRQPDGSWMDVTASLVSSGVISYATFFDGREGTNVNAMDLDVGLLGSSGYFPSNGVIYSSIDQTGGNFNAIRLVNGQELPAGLTVATDNPMYTLGDYNTVNKQPAALLADAITILSNNWDDSRSGMTVNDRLATRTQVNASYLTGNTETGAPGHDYCGGLENLPRFLENWSGVDFVWRGSAVDLWYSRQATSPWSYGSYYKAPNRDWAFDPDLLDPNNLPPGTPQVNVFIRTFWRQTVLSDFSVFWGDSY